MHRVPVESSMIDSVGFEKNVLEVRFRNGGLYQYLDVPESVLALLMQAGSKGRFFNEHVRGRYPVVRLERGQATVAR
ncbi:MAG: KTSC domain-containing protein [Solirubrobacterales bacterium]